MSDIVSQKLNDKFIAKLRASGECQKKQWMTENRVRDNSILTAIAINFTPEADHQDDETQPLSDSQK